MTYNQNSEQLARDEIDRQLLASGWVVQSKNKINLAAAQGWPLGNTRPILARPIMIFFELSDRVELL